MRWRLWGIWKSVPVEPIRLWSSWRSWRILPHEGLAFILSVIEFFALTSLFNLGVDCRQSTIKCVESAKELLKDHPELIRGFNTFVPDELTAPRPPNYYEALSMIARVKVSSYLCRQGLNRSKLKHTLYALFNKDGSWLIACLYVDDLILTGNNACLIDEFKLRLFGEFEMSDLGKLSYFLGLEVEQ